MGKLYTDDVGERMPAKEGMDLSLRVGCGVTAKTKALPSASMPAFRPLGGFHFNVSIPHHTVTRSVGMKRLLYLAK
jgi:hypothetical protein